jgi:hypothetical protein
VNRLAAAAVTPSNAGARRRARSHLGRDDGVMSSSSLTPGGATVAFVTGVYSPEDLARIPGTGWLVTTGMAGAENQGHLYAVEIDRMQATEIYPAGAEHRLDRATYGDVDPPDLHDFSAVGIGLRAGEAGVHTVYVVNHGGRSAVEVFEIDATGDRPVAAWVGVIHLDTGVLGNAVAPLPGGGIVATNFMSLEDPGAFDDVLAGRPTGNLKEWHPETGWEDVPGTECCAANGVDVSPDGAWCFVNSWAVNRVLRVSRGRTPVQRDEVQLSILPDNVKWTERGRLLVTGQESDATTVFAGVRAGPTYDVSLKVIAIDPDTLAVDELLRFSEPGGFGTASTALDVDGTIWVGTARGDRLAAFRLP